MKLIFFLLLGLLTLNSLVSKHLRFYYYYCQFFEFFLLPFELFRRRGCSRWRREPFTHKWWRRECFFALGGRTAKIIHSDDSREKIGFDFSSPPRLSPPRKLAPAPRRKILHAWCAPKKKKFPEIEKPNFFFSPLHWHYAHFAEKTYKCVVCATRPPRSNTYWNLWSGQFQHVPIIWLEFSNTVCINKVFIWKVHFFPSWFGYGRSACSLWCVLFFCQSLNQTIKLHTSPPTLFKNSKI